MDFILLNKIFFSIGIIVIFGYGYWLMRYRLGLPKAYNDFMNVIIERELLIT